METISILSGADFGGSCYLLEMDGVRILFDCGVKTGSAYTDHPIIESPETIDAIFISHAHLDHMGAIAYAAAVCKNAKIYMTAHTKEFMRYQLAATIAEYIGADTDDLKFNNRILCELVMNRIETVEYDKKLSFNAKGKTCHFSLFHAGHIPGAAMIYLKINNRTFLYSGDFSALETQLTFPYIFPGTVKADVLLLCGTHADDKNYTIVEQNALSAATHKLFDSFGRCSKVVIPVTQLTKGLEIIATLENLIDNGDFPECPIYIEPDLWDLASYYEQRSDTFRIPSYAKPLSKWSKDNEESRTIIFEKAKYDNKKYKLFKRLNVDFTLHADYPDIVNMINTVQPKKVFVVHTAGKTEALCSESFDGCNPIVTYTKNTAIYNID